MIACTNCREAGCEHCENGYVVYRQCPPQTLPQDMYSSVAEAEMLDAGILPVAGGLHDQDAYFVEFAKLFLSYKNEMEYSE